MVWSMHLEKCTEGETNWVWSILEEEERENTDSAERSPTKQVNDDESNTLAE